MVKANSFYANETIYFVTKHGKEEILAPLFQEIGIRCKRIALDTDQFGTFSGEVERTGSVRETLRKKISAAASGFAEGRLFLSSEGSFSSDSLFGFLQSDLESLLLWDRELGTEIYAEYLDRAPVHAEASFGPSDDFHEFLEKIDFPEHATMVSPEGQYMPMFKGLKSEHDVAQAMLECFWHSTTGEVVIATDLRADQNRTRRVAIRKAGEALIGKLQSLCPKCSVPGFSISRGLPGLRCIGCGKPSTVPATVLFQCVGCGHKEEKSRPDGISRLPIEECEYCNP